MLPRPCGGVQTALAGVAVLSCTIAAQPAPAQTRDTVPADTPAFVLPPLNVTVTRGLFALERVPAAVSALDATAIQQARPNVSPDEALSVVPGVVVSNRETYALDSRIAIRGFGARSGFGVRGVRVLVDGIPLSMPDGQAPLNNLDLGSTGRIEVLRGPASSLYGNAAGGVIAFETEAPPLAAGGEARLVVGDLGTSDALNLRRVQLKAGGHHGRTSLLVSAAHLESDGYRDHSRTQHTVLTGRARHALDEASYLSAVVNAAHMPVARNPGSLPRDVAETDPTRAWTANVNQGTGKSATQGQAGLGYVRQLGERRLELRAYGLSRSMENPLPGRVIDLDRQGGGVRATYLTSPVNLGVPVRILAGFDLELQRDDRHEFDNVSGRPGPQVFRSQEDRVTSAGPFAQASLALTPSLAATLGLRFDQLRFSTTDRPARRTTDDEDASGGRTFRAASPMFGLTLRASPGLHFYGSVATAFQTPTTTELINAPPAPGETDPAPGFNTDLSPERAVSYEVGARGRVAGRLDYSASVFVQRIDDLILPFQVQDIDRDFFRNAGQSRQRGLELMAHLFLTERLSTQLSYAYSRFLFGEPDQGTAENRLPGVAPHRVFSRTAYRHGSRFFAELDAEWVDRFYVDDANSARNPDYLVVGLRLGGRIHGARRSYEPFMGVRNLLDQRYNGSVVVNAFGGRYYEPAPGRTFYAGVGVPFGGWTGR